MKERRCSAAKMMCGSSTYEFDDQEKHWRAIFPAFCGNACGNVLGMHGQTTKKTDAIRLLLERHAEAANNITTATKEFHKTEAAIRKWLGVELAPFYEQWLPRIGEDAVHVFIGETRKFADKMHVHEMFGTWINFGKDNPDRWCMRFELGNYKKYFKADKDLVAIEFIVPVQVYEHHVRVWFGLPKYAKLES